jgi:hypothetical protein
MERLGAHANVSKTGYGLLFANNLRSAAAPSSTLLLDVMHKTSARLTDKKIAKCETKIEALLEMCTDGKSTLAIFYSIS